MKMMRDSKEGLFSKKGQGIVIYSKNLDFLNRDHTNRNELFPMDFANYT